MKFSEIPYARPNMEEYKSSFKELLSSFENADNFEKQHDSFLSLQRLKDDFRTMLQYSFISADLNTTDEFYQKEVAFFNENKPVSGQLEKEYALALNKATFKKEFVDKYGQQLFDVAAVKVKSFDPTIAEELKEEGHLMQTYNKLVGMAKFELNGESHNLSSLRKFFSDKDRNVRKAAHKANADGFASKQQELDEIFDKLVKVRHQMALKLGYNNYNELGHLLKERIDFDSTMIAEFRKQIKEHFVPLATKINKRKCQRLGYEKIHVYDTSYQFVSGNPTPKGTPEEILLKGQKMYQSLSKETSDFFNYLMEYELLDVTNRPGKAHLAYSWELSKYKHPFIFAVFNGTAMDIMLFTHESGHAFQYFNSKDLITEYQHSLAEISEIHSMSMDFFTYPYMESFFEEDANKFFLMHLSRSITIIPFSCAVDHFQEIIYKNPALTPDERCEVWKEMQAMYVPSVDYDLTPYLKSGRFWQYVPHNFNYPLYSISYALAQICAFQFWQKDQQNHDKAWNEYLTLCKAGGSKSYLELLELANLNSPFVTGTVESIAKDLDTYLETIDDSKF